MRTYSLGQQWTLLLLALPIIGLLFLRFHPPSPSLPGRTDGEYVVEVTGKVREPGVHLFLKLPTLAEAIEKAGGLLETPSSTTQIPSIVLTQGTLLTVAKASPKAGPGEIRIDIGRMEAGKLLVFYIPLDLNEVSQEDLCLVPGIGESLAREIVSDRQRRRGFRTVEELRNVKGVGDKKWTTLKRYFKVAAPERH